MAIATYPQPLFGLGGSVPRKTLDLSQVAQMPVNAGMTGQDAILARLNPLLQQQRSASETQWTNQGLRPGGEAYDNAANLLGQQENDARTQAVLQGLNLDLNANQQGFGQAVQSGEFENNAAGQGFNQNLAGQGQAFNQNLAGQQFGYQQQNDQRAIDAAQHNSTMSGLFGLAGSVGAPLLGKAIGNIGGKVAGQAAGAAAPAIGTAAVPHAATGITGALGLGGGAGLFGLGAATIPVIGGALAAGGLIWRASQAHQTADKWTSGQQGPFDQTMQQIAQQEASGQIPPEQAQQLKQQNAQNYLTALQQFRAKGGKSKTVGDQALATFRQYYGDPQQYGVAIA